MINSTIVALSTPPGTGGIAVVRISGADTLKVLDKLIISKPAPKQWEARRLHNCTIKTSGFEEKGLGVVFLAPNSYTGENLAELHIHGSMAIADGIIAAAVAAGAKPAARGEFTMRAYLSGKMDLTQAEGINDLINSETDAQIAAAQSLADGRLYGFIESTQNTVKNLLAQIGAAADYPEEDIEEPTAVEIAAKVGEITALLKTLADSYAAGRLIKNGVKVTIIGPPNAGKSMLFNALLGKSRAIVNERAGTTRDTVEDGYIYKNMKFLLTDTAGLRETSDEIEREGIIRSYQAAKEAVIVLEVNECQSPNVIASPSATLGTGSAKQSALEKNVIKVGNKCDLNSDNNFSLLIPNSSFDILVSAKTNHNINALKELIYARTATAEQVPAVMLSNARQFSAVQEAAEAVVRAGEAIAAAGSGGLDCASVELLAVYKALGLVTGKTASVHIVNQVFADFCVGK